MFKDKSAFVDQKDDVHNIFSNRRDLQKYYGDNISRNKKNAFIKTTFTQELQKSMRFAVGVGVVYH